jgi:hypothetical protein
MDITDHRVKYSARFLFPCKMNASASSGILETCKCRISIRMASPENETNAVQIE